MVLIIMSKVRSWQKSAISMNVIKEPVAQAKEAFDLIQQYETKFKEFINKLAKLSQYYKFSEGKVDLTKEVKGNTEYRFYEEHRMYGTVGIINGDHVKRIDVNLCYDLVMKQLNDNDELKEALHKDFSLIFPDQNIQDFNIDIRYLNNLQIRYLVSKIEEVTNHDFNNPLNKSLIADKKSSWFILKDSAEAKCNISSKSYINQLTKDDRNLNKSANKILFNKLIDLTDKMHDLYEEILKLDNRQSKENLDNHQSKENLNNQPSKNHKNLSENLNDLNSGDWQAAKNIVNNLFGKLDIFNLFQTNLKDQSSKTTESSSTQEPTKEAENMPKSATDQQDNQQISTFLLPINSEVVTDKIHANFQSLFDRIITFNKASCFSQAIIKQQQATRCLINIDKSTKVNCDELQKQADLFTNNCDYIFPMFTNQDELIQTKLKDSAKIEVSFQEGAMEFHSHGQLGIYEEIKAKDKQTPTNDQITSSIEFSYEQGADQQASISLTGEAQLLEMTNN